MTWHNVPANLWTITCMPTIRSRQQRTSGEGKRCNKTGDKSVCVQGACELCRECGSVTGGTFENNTGWKRGVMWLVGGLCAREDSGLLYTNRYSCNVGFLRRYKRKAQLVRLDLWNVPRVVFTGVFALLTEVSGRNVLKEQVTQNSQCHHKLHVIPNPYYFAMFWNTRGGRISEIQFSIQQDCALLYPSLQMTLQSIIKHRSKLYDSCLLKNYVF